jgi:hypothetical protein
VIVSVGFADQVGVLLFKEPGECGSHRPILCPVEELSAPVQFSDRLAVVNGIRPAREDEEAAKEEAQSRCERQKTHGALSWGTRVEDRTGLSCQTPDRLSMPLTTILARSCTEAFLVVILFSEKGRKSLT